MTRDEQCDEASSASSINETLLHHSHPAPPPGDLGQMESTRSVLQHWFPHMTRLVDDLRDFLDDLEFKATRLAVPLLRPFETSSEPSAIDEGELDKLKSKLKHVCVAP
jgi:hypothetical protein